MSQSTTQGVLPARGDLSRSDWLALLRADQFRRCRAGSPFRVEEYRERLPELQGDPEAVLGLITYEIVLRDSFDGLPTAEEYLARFPDHLERLQRFFDLIGQLRTAAGVSSATLTIPGYEVLEEVGQGGMGVVYRARQIALNRIVALKLIRGGAYLQGEQRQRFRTEAEAIARLHHPNIVQIHEVGEHNGLPYLSLEWVDGGRLSETLRADSMPVRDAAELMVLLADAVRHAHERSILHRDLKPGNILLATDEHRSTQMKSGAEPPIRVHPCSSVANSLPKITDFGLAKQLEDDIHLTRSGAILGTPSYMAPEQAAGRTADIGPATDVYALGAILYECLTGRPPFRAESTIKTLELVRFQEPLRPRALRPDMPSDLEMICLKCLEKESRRRYGSAREMGDDLQRFLAGEPIAARPLRQWQMLARWASQRWLSLGMLAAISISLLVVAVFMGFVRVTQPDMIALSAATLQNIVTMVLSFASVALGVVMALGSVVRRRTRTIGLGGLALVIIVMGDLLIDFQAWPQVLTALVGGLIMGLIMGTISRWVSRRLTSDPIDTALGAFPGAILGAIFGGVILEAVVMTDRSWLDRESGTIWIVLIVSLCWQLTAMIGGMILGAISGATRSPRRRELQAMAARTQEQTLPRSS